MSSEQDAVERCCKCDDGTGRAGRADDSLYCDGCDTGPYCPECWELHHNADQALEASQQENERLRGEYRRYLAFIVDFTTHYHRLTKSQRNAQIMQLRKDAKEKLEAALEEGTQDEQ